MPYIAGDMESISEKATPRRRGRAASVGRAKAAVNTRDANENGALAAAQLEAPARSPPSVTEASSGAPSSKEASVAQPRPVSRGAVSEKIIMAPDGADVVSSPPAAPDVISPPRSKPSSRWCSFHTVRRLCCCLMALAALLPLSIGAYFGFTAWKAKREGRPWALLPVDHGSPAHPPWSAAAFKSHEVPSPYFMQVRSPWCELVSRFPQSVRTGVCQQRRS